VSISKIDLRFSSRASVTEPVSRASINIFTPHHGCIYWTSNGTLQFCRLTNCPPFLQSLPILTLTISSVEQNLAVQEVRKNRMNLKLSTPLLWG
jgi:hypothetical protein